MAEISRLGSVVSHSVGYAICRRCCRLLAALALCSCAAQKGAEPAAPSPAVATVAPGGGAPIASGPATPAAAGKTIDKLEATHCSRHGFGCGSCVADGIWGALWVEEDCTRHCDTICGSLSANSPNVSALASQFAGPNLLEMKVTLPTEVTTPGKSDQKKKGSTAAAAESISIVEKSSAFTYFANRDSINCGVLGPAYAAITCNPPLVAHCGCEASGSWGKANCDCRQPAAAATRSTAVNNCHVDARPHVSCPAAGLPDVNDPGCATNCVPGHTGVCKDATCVASTWTQSICACFPQ
jgi:hypothetical protein